MKLSSQEEYGLRCLLHLGRHPHSSLTILEISQAEGLSPPNVAKLLRLLRQGGFERDHIQPGCFRFARPLMHGTPVRTVQEWHRELAAEAQLPEVPRPDFADGSAERAVEPIQRGAGSGRELR